MGFLSGILGGGGSTKVTTTTTNKTDVNVSNEIANIIDLSALAEALTAVGESVNGAIGAVGDQTSSLFQALMAQLGINQQAAILTAAAQAQEQDQQNAILGQFYNLVKWSAITFALYWAWRNLI